MTQTEDITLTRHEDGTVTADHFPARTCASADLIATADMAGTYIAITEISILGVRYRVGEKVPHVRAYYLDRVDAKTPD